MAKEVKKAVITAAGRGTRFLPATKIIPKEMLPIGRYPSIHYLLEECRASGVTDVCIVVRERNSLTEKYFLEDQSLGAYLKETGKDDLLEMVENVSLGLNVSFVEQDKSLPYGNGAPVLSARDFIGEDDFIFMQGDDLFVGGDGTPLSEMVKFWQQGVNLKALLGTVNTPRSEIAGKLGSIVTHKMADGGYYLVESIVEKPEPGNVPSNMATVGRVVLSAEIIPRLESQLEDIKSAEGIEQDREFYIWDAIMRFATEEGEVGAIYLSSEWLTTGTPEQMQAAQKKLL